jgi:hypothetical protein
MAELQLMGWTAEHYGCRVVDLGEDGDMWAVAGPKQTEHVDDRRALAAVIHYLRVDCQFTVEELVLEDAKVKRRWVTVVDDDEEPWQWTEDAAPGAWAVTFVEAW